MLAVLCHLYDEERDYHSRDFDEMRRKIAMTDDFDRPAHRRLPA